VTATGAPLGPTPESWLNRSTLGAGLASLFSDVSHELATAVLPSFLLSLGAGPAALGWIEGTADGLSAVAKLWGGAMADRVSRRKPLASIGYLVTAAGIAAIGLCAHWWQVLLCRAVAWLGRGSRTAPRDVLVAESAPPEAQGKAFGLERAGDALGAVIGPLLAVAMIAAGVSPARLMLVSLAPGLLAFLAMTLLVVERPNAPRKNIRATLRMSLASTGRRFRRYLAAILIFGCGDFSRTLLILYATRSLRGTFFSWSSATLAIALYVLHNAVSSAAALPIGALADRVGLRRVVAAGYLFAAAVTAGFGLLPATPAVLTLLFIGSGLGIACEEVGEKALAAEILPAEARGTGMGLLAATNGVGDFLSSALVGTLWAVLPGQAAVGFFGAAALQAVGALTLRGLSERAW
jgi:MFS family permease